METRKKVITKRAETPVSAFGTEFSVFAALSGGGRVKRGV